MQDWGELTGAVIQRSFPILPRPKWGQDTAFVAFIIDGLVKEIAAQQTVIDDLWGCIGQPEIDDLQDETRAQSIANHNALWHTGDGEAHP